MATIEQNAQIIVSTARQMRAIIELAEQIEDGTAIAQAIGEKKAELKAAKDQVEIEKGSYAQIVKEKDEAKEWAKAAIAAAQTSARNLINDAKAESIAKAGEVAKMLEAEKASAAADIASAKAELAAIEADIAEKQEAQKQAAYALNSIEAALKEARAKLGV